VNRAKLCLLVAAGYSAGSLTAFWVLGASDPGPVLFPPAGVTAAALILTERRMWPYILATVGLCELVIDTSQGLPLQQTVWFVAANVVEPTVGASLLRRWHRGPVDLTRRRDSAAFITASVGLGPMVGGAIGATGVAINSSTDFIGAYFPFWAGDALGVLTVGGTILAWTSAPRSLHRRSWAEVVVVLGGLVALTVVGFLPTVVPLSYLPVPLLFFCAFRYGIRVVMAGGLLMTLVANVMTANGHGPWHVLIATPRYEVATLQLFLAIVIFGAWALAVAAADRERERSIAVAEVVANERLTSLQALTRRLALASTTADIATVAIEHAESRICDVAELAITNTDGLHVWRRRNGAVAPASARGQAQFGELLHGMLRTPDAAAPLQRSVYPRMADAATPQRVLAVPLASPVGVLGAIACAWDDGRPVSDEVHSEINSVVQMVGLSLVRAQLFERQQDVAHSLQEALQPDIPSHLGQVTAAAQYHPADPEFDVGGDWYDVFLLEEGRVAFAIGDVMGHDLRAAATMGKLSTTLRLIAPNAKDPADVLEQMDRRVDDVEGAFMCALGFGDFNPQTMVLRFARAGQPPPLISDSSGARLLKGNAGPPLGLATSGRTFTHQDIASDTVVLCYTDGLIERRGEDIDHGLDRLLAHAQTLRTVEPGAWCTSVRRALIGDTALEDDAVILALHLKSALAFER
jgi:serine phosphatase RsbU (regulator of sigma subunit)/integral membrane sensor domain MASE1